MWLFKFVFLSVIVSTCIADSVVQTDWSGGPGTFGPVTSLGTSFFWDTDVAWLSSPGGITLEHINEHCVSSNYLYPHCIDSGDIDSDGDNDLAAVQYTGSQSSVCWWENENGLGTNMIWRQLPGGAFSGASEVHVGDIDGDGWPDLAAAASGDDEIAWWRNANGFGTAWVMHTVGSNFDGAYSVFPVDIDDDGYMDLVGAAYAANEVSWWKNNNGSGTNWTKHIISSTFNGAMRVNSCDIDGDGHTDVLGAAYVDGMISWWENTTGSGLIWVEHVIDNDVNGASSVVPFDVNGDGHLDVIATARWGSGFSWWENDGNSSPSWTEHVVTPEYGGYIDVYPADLDSDGDVDIASSAFESNLVEWWENMDGAGITWEVHLIRDNFSSTGSVHCEDLNGDDLPDVTSTSYSGSEVAWWNLNEYSSLGSFESSVFDTNCECEWGYIDWDASTPTGSAVQMTLRAAVDEMSPGGWSDTLSVPGSLAGVIPDGTRYVQYSAILTTSDCDTTPTLNEVTITWNLTQTEETTAPINGEICLFPFSPNPSTVATVRFYLPEPVHASFYVYDVTGRVVCGVIEDDYPASFGSFLLDGLASGVYFCTMRAGDFSASERVVVID